MIFTSYVRQLASAGGLPSEERLAEVWEELSRLLERELRKRGLWEVPPSYLGIYGHTSWRDQAGVTSETGAWREDGLGELVAELYSYIFIDRLNKLIDYVERGDSIEALVLVNIGHLLFALQKKHDPLGYRVFTVFHEAVKGTVDAEELFVLRGDPKVRNDTILSVRPDFDPERLPPAPVETVGEWNDVLLPDLVNGRGKARQWVVTTLQTFLLRLPKEGTEAFLFRELLDPLKKDTRLRWALRLESTQGEQGLAEGFKEDEMPQLVPLVPPDPQVEDVESLEKLNRCLAAAFDRLEGDQPRSDLKSLWQDLHHRAQDGEVPSQRKLAAEMKFNRRRLSKLFTTLGEMIDDCRQALAGAGAAALGTQGTKGPGGESMKSRAETLRAATAEALRRHVEATAQLEEHGARRPRPGDVFSLAGAGELGVEWVLLRENGGVFDVVPADSSSLASPGDILVPKEAACGPLVLRCAYRVRLTASALDLTQRTGTLPHKLLEQARASIGSAPGPVEDPELGDWIREVIEPACEAVRSLGAEPASSRLREEAGDRRPPASYRRRLSSDLYALAASILLVLSLGLSAGLYWQRQEIVRLHTGTIKAEGNIPYKNLIFFPDDHRGDPESFPVPAEAQKLFLVLNIYELDETFERYRLRVFTKSTNEEVWESEPLVRMSGASLTVKLPTVSVPEGEYLFALYGMKGRREEALAELDLNFEYDDER